MISNLARLAFGAAVALTGAVAIPAAADASVIWDVTGTFSDGTALTGSFTTDVYGYVQTWDLFTQANGPFSALEYNPSTSYRASGFNFVDFQPGYQGDLHLEFADNLTIPSPHNFIVDAASFECQNSYSCYIPDVGPTRYLTGGVADFASTVPEPATWVMLILGFGMTGSALRLAARRRQVVQA
jgi:hypothetical protein